MNKLRLGIGFFVCATIQAYSIGAAADSQLWVTKDRTDRHTCPSIKCGVAGSLMFREGVDALEKKGEWVRISKPYPASCVRGVSEYVKVGNKSCTNDNGVSDGMFAEWVQSKDLSAQRPADPSEGATGDDALVKGSDDYRVYKQQFAKAARQLIGDGTCTESDFKEMGGWMASTNQGSGMYFTYCGGMSLSNKVYLDVKSGKTGR